MHDARLVCRQQRCRDRSCHFQRFPDLQWFGLYAITQRLAIDEFDRDVVELVQLPDVVNGNDVWMIECGGGPGLQLKPVHSFEIFGEVCWQRFEYDLAS